MRCLDGLSIPREPLGEARLDAPMAKSICDNTDEENGLHTDIRVEEIRGPLMNDGKSGNSFVIICLVKELNVRSYVDFILQPDDILAMW